MEEEFTIGVCCDDMTAVKYSEASIPSLAALAMRICASRRDRPLMCASKLEYTVSKISVGRANASGVAALFSTTCLPLGGSRKKSTDDRLLMPSVAVMTRFENISSASASVSTTAAAAISGGPREAVRFLFFPLETKPGVNQTSMRRNSYSHGLDSVDVLIFARAHLPPHRRHRCYYSPTKASSSPVLSLSSSKFDAAPPLIQCSPSRLPPNTRTLFSTFFARAPPLLRRYSRRRLR